MIQTEAITTPDLLLLEIALGCGQNALIICRFLSIVALLAYGNYEI